MPQIALEALGAEHLEPYLRLTDGEGWGYGPDELAELVRHTRGCARVALADGGLVAGTLAFPWGPVGFIGAVVTQPSARGRGIGAAVVQAALSALTDGGCSTVRLLSTPKAVPLYQRLGFVGEREAVLMEGRAPRPSGPQPPQLEDVGALARAEERALGFRRRAYLDRLVDRAPELTAHDPATGTALVTRTFGFPVLGPMASETPAPGLTERLLDHVAGRLGRPCQVVLAQTAVRPCWAEVTATALLMRHGPPAGGRAHQLTLGGEEAG